MAWSVCTPQVTPSWRERSPEHRWVYKISRVRKGISRSALPYGWWNYFVCKQKTKKNLTFHKITEKLFGSLDLVSYSFCLQLYSAAQAHGTLVGQDIQRGSYHPSISVLKTCTKNDRFPKHVFRPFDNHNNKQLQKGWSNRSALSQRRDTNHPRLVLSTPFLWLLKTIAFLQTKSAVPFASILRDSHGIPQVAAITGQKILRLLKAEGVTIGRLCGRGRVTDFLVENSEEWMSLSIKKSFWSQLIIFTFAINRFRQFSHVTVFKDQKICIQSAVCE